MILRQYIPDSLEEQWNAFLESASSELQSNERLKWILLGGAFVLYLSMVAFFANQANDSQRNYLQERDQLARLTAQASESGWPQRSITAESLVNSFTNKFWPGETTGIAEAGFERWIRQSFDRYNTEVRQVLLTRGPALADEADYMQGRLSEVLKIRAKVISPLNEAGLLRFLEDAGTHSSWVVVEQLIIRDGRNPRFEMDIATYSKTGEPDQ
ncbi:MAG: hypothetical protein P8L79_08040 [Rhodospirillaceae bacterium]|jgi:hypothetical protein|nr:hypothetical protein [Rhodospirillaceae bacterium]